MKVIYHCYGGSHSSVTAAALHIGLISKNRPPTTEELMALPYFDKTNNEDFGSIRFMGFDDYGNEVFILGKKNLGDRYSNIIIGIAEILGAKDQVIAINCMNRVNWAMKLGGFTSRKIGAVFLGRPILSIGTRKAFLNLVNLVEITRLKIFNKLQG